MKPDRFKELLDELDGNSLQTLKEKNARYAKDGDCLHNFRKGAAINRNTLAQTCWGYMSKHLVALQDKVESNDFSNREDFLEKCQDTINYIRFLWCIGNEHCADTPAKIDPLDDCKWCFTLPYVNAEAAERFITKCGEIIKQNGTISKADVCKLRGMSYEYDDYHVGWLSTEDWIIMPSIGSDVCLLQIPKPVNI